MPPGSLKKGEELVTKGGAGKTIACNICHGEGLKGLGDVPRLAGLLAAIPGVVEHGLFIGIASQAIVGGTNTVTVLNPDARQS